MKTIIGAKIEVVDYSQKVLDYATNNLIFSNPKYHLNQSIGKSTWGIPKEIVLFERKGNNLILPFGTLKNVYPLVKEFEVETLFKKETTKKLITRTTLRDYQNKAIEECIQAKNGVLVAPCGSGKTLIGMHLISSLNQRTLWIVHTTDLMLQAKSVAEKEFLNLEEGDIGTITDGKINVGNIITFATIQTLSNINLEDYKNYFGVVITDECAHCTGTPTMITMYSSVMNSLIARYKYGLTATPKRIDGLQKGMYALLGNKIYEISDKDVESNKCKATLEIVYCPTAECLDYYDSDYKIIPHKFDEYIALNAPRNAQIALSVYNAYKEGRKHQLILCNRVVQCDILSKILRKSYELKVAVYNGSQKKKDNHIVLQNYNDYDVIIGTYSIASEGLDMPNLDTLHLASPKSKNNKSLIKQCIGRIERYSPEKENAIVYTYEDYNIERSRKTTKLVQLAMGQKGFIFKGE